MITGLFLLSLLLTACGAGSQEAAVEPTAPPTSNPPAPAAAEPEEEPAMEAVQEEDSMQMRIGDTAVAVAWEENGSVAALRELAEALERMAQEIRLCLTPIPKLLCREGEGAAEEYMIV